MTNKEKKAARIRNRAYRRHKNRVKERKKQGIEPPIEKEKYNRNDIVEDYLDEVEEYYTHASNSLEDTL